MPDKYFGKYTGIVKDNRDSQKLGQLQVSVPAIFPEEELMTARPALPYGFFFVPEVNAKVWVEFEGGESGLPLWTGIQYVSGEWPGEAAVDPPEKRVVKTAAGHYVIFNDKSDEQGIEIKDGSNQHAIKLDKDGIEINDGANKHTVKLDKDGIEVNDGANKQTIKLDKDGIEVKGLKIMIKDGQIELTDGTVTMKIANGVVNIS